MGTFKNALKKILPPPVNSFMREVNRIVVLEEKNRAMIQQLLQRVEQQEQQIKKQEKLLCIQKENLALYAKQLEQQNKGIIEVLDKSKQKYVQAAKQIEEKQQCMLNRIGQLQSESNLQKNQIVQIEKNTIKQMQQPILEYFVLNILDHCNLCCKGCDHFAAIAEERFVSLEHIEKDLARMSELMNQQVARIGIMGGEPLLHPELLQILALAREYFPNTLLQLVTNGLLLMNQSEEFWQTCKEHNIVIVNTKYPINLDYDGMIARAEKYGVTFEHYGNTGEKMKTSYKMPLDLSGKQNPRSNYLKCHHSNNCALLMEGKFYACTVAPNVKIFNKRFGTNLQLVEEDYLDIYKVTDKHEILKFLSRPIPFCRFCDVEHRQYGLEWERSKQIKEEWLSD